MLVVAGVAIAVPAATVTAKRLISCATDQPPLEMPAAPRYPAARHAASSAPIASAL